MYELLASLILQSLVKYSCHILSDVRQYFWYLTRCSTHNFCFTHNCRHVPFTFTRVVVTVICLHILKVSATVPICVALNMVVEFSKYSIGLTLLKHCRLCCLFPRSYNALLYPTLHFFVECLSSGKVFTGTNVIFQSIGIS